MLLNKWHIIQRVHVEVLVVGENENNIWLLLAGQLGSHENMLSVRVLAKPGSGDWAEQKRCNDSKSKMHVWP